MNKATRPQTPDRDLLRKAAQGNDSAFGELYDRYNVPIYNYLLRLIHEQTASEDLLQEVFVAAWQGAGRFRGRSSVKTWLFRIAHNQAVSWLRRNTKEQPSPQTAVELPESAPGDETTPEAQIIASWQEGQIIEALDQLSEKHRAVVELTFVYDFSQREIADIMNCPTGTVKSRMSYALQRLNGIMQKMGVRDQ